MVTPLTELFGWWDKSELGISRCRYSVVLDGSIALFPAFNLLAATAISLHGSKDEIAPIQHTFSWQMYATRLEVARHEDDARPSPRC